jgi:hypothetical protein
LLRLRDARTECCQLLLAVLVRRLQQLVVSHGQAAPLLHTLGQPLGVDYVRCSSLTAAKLVSYARSHLLRNDVRHKGSRTVLEAAAVQENEVSESVNVGRGETVHQNANALEDGTAYASVPEPKERSRRRSSSNTSWARNIRSRRVGRAPLYQPRSVLLVLCVLLCGSNRHVIAVSLPCADADGIPVSVWLSQLLGLLSNSLRLWHPLLLLRHQPITVGHLVPKKVIFVVHGRNTEGRRGQ